MGNLEKIFKLLYYLTQVIFFITSLLKSVAICPRYKSDVNHQLKQNLQISLQVQINFEINHLLQKKK